MATKQDHSPSRDLAHAGGVKRHTELSVTTGADRAAERLAAKLKANAALYAHLPAKPDSRQVKRRRVLKASKASFGRTVARRRQGL